MCGITGIIRFDEHRINENTLIGMRDSMSYRGPDDSGIYINKKKSVALAHRRLSILDLSPLGHQPISNEDENIWLVHNGEIYNFPEIKRELQNSGHMFSSTSDTEVIIKAYQEWGEKAFKKFNGMFAFCIYDRRNDSVYLARDHSGIKPLYYSITDRGLIFSSEVKAFNVIDDKWEENRDWRTYFLVFGHIPEPFTTLENVYMFPKGNFLKLNLKTKKHTFTEYSKFEFTNAITNTGDAIQGIRELFTKAVQRHLISDAPIGVFLSGGIDSSIIALLAHRFQKESLRTLSVVFDEKAFSEERYQNIILDKIKSKHNAYRVTEKDFIQSLDNIFLAMDQPTTDGINTYFVSKCAKEEGLKAVLSGLGGDELFGGYPSFRRIDYTWFLKNSIFTGLLKPFKYALNDKWKKLSFLSMKNPLGYYLFFRGFYSPSIAARILEIDEREVERALEKIYFDAMDSMGRKDFVSYLETNFYMQNQLLKDTDYMSMRHSIEVRVPFLDNEFLRYAYSIKDTVKFNNGIPKYLLVKAFEDILPEEIVTRKKQGFTFPFDQWFRKIGKALISEATLKNNMNKSYVERLWHKFERGDLHWSRVWGIVVMGNK